MNRITACLTLAIVTTSCDTGLFGPEPEHKPTACFTIPEGHPKLGVPMQPTNCSDDAYCYFWNVENDSTGLMSELAEPEMIWRRPGSYYIELTAYSESGQLHDQEGLYVTLEE